MLSQEDFLVEATRFSVVIMHKMGFPIMSNFKNLTERQKAKFNKMLNEYIHSLGEEWRETLIKDFNELTQDYMDTFDPAKEFVRDEVPLAPIEEKDWYSEIKSS